MSQLPYSRYALARTSRQIKAEAGSSGAWPFRTTHRGSQALKGPKPHERRSIDHHGVASAGDLRQQDAPNDRAGVTCSPVFFGDPTDCFGRAGKRRAMTPRRTQDAVTPPTTRNG